MINQLFGSKKLAILSKQDIRYEGTLVSINNDDQSVVLKDVQSCGTEGRRPGNEIPASSVIYDLISFRGTDVKNLWALDEDKTKSASSAQLPPTGPVSGTPGVMNFPGMQAPFNMGQGGFGGQQQQMPFSGFQQPMMPPMMKPGEQGSQQQGGFPGFQPPVGMGQGPAQVDGGKKEQDAQEKEEEEDLDIEKMNEKFQRVELEEDKEEEYQQKQYKQKGFFDTISNTTDTKSQRETREERLVSKKTDEDTFGQDYISNTQMSYANNNRNRYNNNNNRRGGYNNNNRRGGNNYRHHNNNNNYNNNYNNRDRDNNNRDRDNNNNNNYRNHNNNYNNNNYNQNRQHNNNYQNNRSYNNNDGYNNYNNYNNQKRGGGGLRVQRGGRGPKPYYPKQDQDNNRQNENNQQQQQNNEQEQTQQQQTQEEKDN